MIKVLLTGANGQVGKEIQRAVPDFAKLCSYDKRALDITSRGAITSAITECQPNFVINAAAYTAVDKAEKESELAYAINATGVLHLAEACQKVSIPLIHISTDYVFDGQHDKPYSEIDPVAPLSVYGKSKWEGELAVRQVLRKHIILRTSWVFGRFGNNFVKTILRLAKEHEDLRIISDQYGCPTAAQDIAKVIWQIIKQVSQTKSENIPWGTYHFANAQPVSWYDFAKKILIVARINKEVKAIKTEDYPTLAKRPIYSVLNCQKIIENYHITPQHWENVLSEVVFSLLH